MLSPFTHGPLRRRWLAWRAPEGPLKDFYAIPWPSRKTAYREVEFIALDLETTGLDPIKHEIVSIGWIPIREGRLIHGEAGYRVVRPKKGLQDSSTVIHGITDDQVAEAPPIEEVLGEVLSVLAGRVMVAHRAQIELSFLSAACRVQHATPFRMMTADTLTLEHRRLLMANQTVGYGDLRLNTVRGRYNLPRYRAHNALIDAISCAELFLAQAQYKKSNKPLSLSALIS